MRVYFNNIDAKGLHSVYKELLSHPPIKYINLNKNKPRGKKPIYFFWGKKILNVLKVPTFNFVSNDIDLIHSCTSIPVSRSPFVVDFEHISVFAGMNLDRLNSKFFKKILRKILESKKCKKILPWTDAAKKSLLNFIPSKIIESKIEVVYPAIRLPNFRKKKKKEFTILFVAYNFHRKGGEELLRAFLKLRKKIQKIKLNIVCKKEPEFSKYNFECINFTGLIPRKILLEKYYPNADLFVYPSIHDTFGMVYLEAMSFGLPVITLDGFATKEIIQNKKNGFVIKTNGKRWFDKNYLIRKGADKWKNIAAWRTEEEKNRCVDELFDKMKLLIENQKMREKMGKNNQLLIKEGKFSINHRNKKLKKIYKEAIA